jgi:hypothetical protein
MEVCVPDGDVNVGVIPRPSADVEINRPAAEEPVVDALRSEERLQPADGVQLRGGPAIRCHGTILSARPTIRASARSRLLCSPHPVQQRSDGELTARPQAGRCGGSS